MITDFNNIPDEAKIWIFPSSRKFYPQEISVLQEHITTFLKTWIQDNSSFNCSYILKYDRFIIIAANDTQHRLSLEDHDELTSFIVELEKKFSILLMDRINVCFKLGDYVQYKELKAFKTLIKNKGVSKKTTVFNNMVNTKVALESDWEINITESWLSRLL